MQDATLPIPSGINAFDGQKLLMLPRMMVDSHDMTLKPMSAVHAPERIDPDGRFEAFSSLRDANDDEDDHEPSSGNPDSVFKPGAHRQHKPSSRARFNIKFDSNIRDDSNGLKRSFLQACKEHYIPHNIASRSVYWKTISSVLSRQKVWEPFMLLTEKKISAAYHKLMAPIADEMRRGTLNPQVTANLPDFLVWAMEIISKEPEKWFLKPYIDPQAPAEALMQLRNMPLPSGPVLGGAGPLSGSGVPSAGHGSSSPTPTHAAVPGSVLAAAVAAQSLTSLSTGSMSLNMMANVATSQPSAKIPPRIYPESSLLLLPAPLQQLSHTSASLAMGPTAMRPLSALAGTPSPSASADASPPQLSPPTPSDEGKVLALKGEKRPLSETGEVADYQGPDLTSKRARGRLSGKDLAEKLVDDDERDLISQQLRALGVINIADLLQASDMSPAGRAVLEEEFSATKPVARILRPIGEALLEGELQVSALEKTFRLNKGDAMDLYDYLRETICI